MKIPETIDDLAPAPYNPRRISDAAASGLCASMQQFGDIAGITYNQRTGHLVSGHQRVSQLRKLGAQLERDESGNVSLVLDDDKFAVRVVNWSIAAERAANVVANNPHIAGVFTRDLEALLPPIRKHLGPEIFGAVGLDTLLREQSQIASEVHAGEDEDGEGQTDSLSDSIGLSEKYTRKITGPVYEITGECPSVSSLTDTSKRDALLDEIGKHELPPDVRRFLELSAERHTVFDYQSIAEYYAHASAETQRLMEDSALVIIDFNKAIEGGFIRLTKQIRDSFIDDQERDHE
jgi:hypothetical protein